MGKFQECFIGVLRVFEKSSTGLSLKFQWCFKSVLRKFQSQVQTMPVECYIALISIIIHRCEIKSTQLC